MTAIFKKWDLQVTFPVKCIHTCAMCRVHSHYEFIKPAMSVYIVREQFRHH